MIHLGAWTHHIGVYPGAAATVAFADELRVFKTSKGAIRIPHDAPLPLELVRRITRWRVEQIARAPATRAAEYPRVAIASRGEWRTWLEAEHLRAFSEVAKIAAIAEAAESRLADRRQLRQQALLECSMPQVRCQLS